jgi:hypothetical protein
LILCSHFISFNSLSNCLVLCFYLPILGLHSKHYFLDLLKAAIKHDELERHIFLEDRLVKCSSNVDMGQWTRGHFILEIIILDQLLGFRFHQNYFKLLIRYCISISDRKSLFSHIYKAGYASQTNRTNVIIIRVKWLAKFIQW